MEIIASTEYKCSFCDLTSKHKPIIEKHETSDCWKNPATKFCGTCMNKKCPHSYTPYLRTLKENCYNGKHNDKYDRPEWMLNKMKKGV